MAAGIYTIANTKNGTIYVGRSTNAEQQIAMVQQQLNNGEHQNEKLQEDWDSYGAEVFNFRVIERVDRERDLPSRQQWWIDQYLATHGEEFIYNAVSQSGARATEIESPEAGGEPGTGSKIAASSCLGCGTLFVIAFIVTLIFGDGATNFGIGAGVVLGLVVFVKSLNFDQKS